MTPNVINSEHSYCLRKCKLNFIIKYSSLCNYLLDISEQVGEMASNTMKVAALGRPFTLGMLYDAREDRLIPGKS